MKERDKKRLNSILNLYIGVGVALWILAAIVILIPIAPSILYKIFPESEGNEVLSLTDNIDDDRDELEKLREKYNATNPPAKPESKLPPFDESLTTKNMLTIKKIGVNAEIQEGSNWEKELKEGPWKVTDFGTPDKDEQFKPTIIASHRWGTIFWDRKEREKLSFYKLPELKKGDRVEIIWEQRKYIYEIYRAEEGSKVTDYDADLILYTCKLLRQSDVRIFRYAKRVN